MKMILSRRRDAAPALFLFERTVDGDTVLYTLQGPPGHESQAHDWALATRAGTIEQDEAQGFTVKWRYSPTNEDPLITLAEAAKIVDLAASTLRRHASGERLPQLPAKLYGKTWLVHRADLDAWKTAYDAAPKLGRRGDGSVRAKFRKKDHAPHAE